MESASCPALTSQSLLNSVVDNDADKDRHVFLSSSEMTLRTMDTKYALDLLQISCPTSERP